MVSSSTGAWATVVFDFKNYLPNVSKCLTFYLLPDHRNIYFESYDLLTIQKVVNQKLRKIRKWLEANWLALNIEKKNNFVFFHSTQHKLTHHIYSKISHKKIKQKTLVQLFWVYY